MLSRGAPCNALAAGIPHRREEGPAPHRPAPAATEILTRLDQITADLTDAEASATCIYAVYNSTNGDIAVLMART
jgi:hypothetical protein